MPTSARRPIAEAISHGRGHRHHRPRGRSRASPSDRASPTSAGMPTTTIASAGRDRRRPPHRVRHPGHRRHQHRLAADSPIRRTSDFPIVEVSARRLVRRHQAAGHRRPSRRADRQGTARSTRSAIPRAYLSPDATVSFLTLQVEDEGNDRVRVSGRDRRRRRRRRTKSAPPTGPDFGPRARCWSSAAMRSPKRRRCGEIVLARLREAGCEPARVAGRVPGQRACGAGRRSDPPAEIVMETVLRISVADPRREVVERFTRELTPLITAGPQGITGYAEGRPAVREVFGYWPTLDPPRRRCGRPSKCWRSDPCRRSTRRYRLRPQRRQRLVGQRRRHRPQAPRVIVSPSRSAHRGASAGVLPADGRRHGRSLRLPNLGALNFVLRGILDGGGSVNLRIDAQGKALGQAILEMQHRRAADASESRDSAHD